MSRLRRALGVRPLASHVNGLGLNRLPFLLAIALLAWAIVVPSTQAAPPQAKNPKQPSAAAQKAASDEKTREKAARDRAATKKADDKQRVKETKAAIAKGKIPNAKAGLATESFTPTSHTTYADGKITETLSTQPTYKQTATGWKEMSGDLTPTKGQFAFETDNTQLPMRFARKGDSVLQIEAPWGPVDVQLAGAKLSEPTMKQENGNHLLHYATVFPGVDLDYSVHGATVQKSLVIQDKASLRSFEFDIVDPKHHLGTVTQEPDGSAQFSTEVATGIGLGISAAAAWSTTPGSANLKSAGSAQQKVSETPTGYSVTLQASDEWAQAQTFPIVLDPTFYFFYTVGGETISAAFAPIGSTACSGNPCPLASLPDGSSYVSAVGTGQGETRAYFHMDLSNLGDDPQVAHAMFFADYTYGAAFPQTDLHVVNGLLSPGATGADLAAAEDPSVLASFAANTIRYGVDIAAQVNAWAASGHANEAGLALQVAPGQTEDYPASDPLQCINDFYNYYSACFGPPVLLLNYSGLPKPPPIPVEQAWGCACELNHGAATHLNLADPVSTVDGNATETVTDLTSPAPGIPMELTRTYNGLDTINGILGTGWQDAFSASLSVDPLNSSVTFRDPSGGQSKYWPQLDGSYLGDPGATAHLASVLAGGWTLTSMRGETWTFDGDGRLVTDTDTDAAGNGLSFGWDAPAPSGKITTITDAASGVTSLTYGSSGAAAGKLVTVEAPDSREVHYSYTTVNGSPHLTAVTAADGGITQIGYDATTGRLNSITSPGGGEGAQNTYDVNGRITSQTDANGHTWTFDWEPSSNVSDPPGTGTSTSTDPTGVVTYDFYYGSVLAAHSDAEGNTTFYQYDDDLDLVGVTDPLGQLTKMTYDGAGNMLTQTQGTISSITESWTYDAHNNMTSHTDGNGHTTTYAYDSDDQLTSETDALSGITSYTYDGDGNMLTRTSPEGRTTTWTYDSAGNVLSEETAEGEVTTYTYDGAGRVLTETGPRGNQLGATAEDFRTHYTYDDAGRVLTVTDPNDTVTTNTYDDDGNMLESVVVDAGSHTMSDDEWTYDDVGNMLTHVQAGRTVETRTYDDANRLASSTDATGAKTTYLYDSNGRVDYKGLPASNVSPSSPFYQSSWSYSYDYDADGRLDSTEDPGWHYTDYQYDTFGRYIGQYEGSSLRNATTYDANGNPLTVTTDGLVTTSTYDALNRLTSRAVGNGSATTWSYDGDGNRVSETSPSGDSVTTYAYDADNRLTSAVDPLGNAPGGTPAAHTTTYTYDAGGNQTSQTDALSHTTSWAYDALGNRISETDANSHTTDRTYDALGRVTAVDPPGAGNTTTYAYDSHGDLVTRTDPEGHTTTYAYDHRHSVTSVTDPLGREKTFTYDPAGNLSSWTDARGNAPGATAADWTVHQEFDWQGRLTQRTTPDGSGDATFGWGRDSLSYYDDASGETSVDQFSDGRVSQVGAYDWSDPYNPVWVGYSYTYDDQGRLTEIDYPDGKAETRTYNADGEQLTSTVDGQTTTYTYDLDGHLTGVAYPSGVGLSESRSYDAAGQLSEVQLAAPSPAAPVDRFSYTRDAVGNPASVTRTQGATSTDESYSYDARDQLTRYCVGTSTCNGSAAQYDAYTYDTVGNRTQLDRVGGSSPGTTTYSYDHADELTSATTTPIVGSPSTTNYAYDADGNLTSAGRTWNTLNQLTASNVNSVAATYTYDAMGNRTSVVTGAGTRTLSWDQHASLDRTGGLPMLAEITDPAGSIDHQAYDPDTALLSTTSTPTSGPTTVQYYGHDQLGSVTDSVDDTGTPLTATAYAPFGEDTTAVLSVGANAPPFGYTGGYEEPALDQIALRARDYDPTLGRFTATDPVNEAITDPYVATYVYTDNQPTTLTDPAGLCLGLGLLCTLAKAEFSLGLNMGVQTWSTTTNHVGGCVWNYQLSSLAKTSGECGLLFTDLASLGGIENSAHDLAGCYNSDVGACGRAWVDLFALGMGVKAGAAGLPCRLGAAKSADEVCRYRPRWDSPVPRRSARQEPVLRRTRSRPTRFEDEGDGRIRSAERQYALCAPGAWRCWGRQDHRPSDGRLHGHPPTRWICRHDVPRHESEGLTKCRCVSRPGLAITPSGG